MIVAMRLRPFHFARVGPALDRSFGRRDQALALMLALGVVLAACGRAPKAPDMPRAPVGLQERFYAPRGWTWSGLKVGDEVWRYGVASPPVVPRGSVLILTGGEDPAEVWFETANGLIAKGYTVWLLEARPSPRATGALGQIIDQVIRPRAGQPLVVVADGLGANVALDGIAASSARASAIILQRPAMQIADRVRWLTPIRAETTARWAVKLGLGGLAVPATEALQAPADASFDPRRAKLAAAWRRADPALRSRPPTWRWIYGYDLTAARATRRNGNPSRTPIIMADETGALANLCARISGCEEHRDIGHAAQMQADEVRSRWLAEIVSLLERYRTAKP